MIIIAGTVFVQEANMEQAKALALTMANATHAEAGCIEYRFYNDLENPSKFFIFERWETQEALTKHFQTEHMCTFNEQLPQVLASKPEIYRYEVSNSSLM
ncbi:MAG: putative quinol monooxygenase [Trueperaceae bacterium]